MLLLMLSALDRLLATRLSRSDWAAMAEPAISKILNEDILILPSAPFSRKRSCRSESGAWPGIAPRFRRNASVPVPFPRYCRPGWAATADETALLPVNPAPSPPDASRAWQRDGAG